VTSFLQSWLRQPQRTWLRRAFFQIHLWSGLILGLYIVAVCVSGSAIVFRIEIYDALNARKKVTQIGTALKGEELKSRLVQTYPGWTVKEIEPPLYPDEAAEATLVRGNVEKNRLVNPYTGGDHGAPVALQFRVMRWLSALHGKLLWEENGYMWNGIGGLLLGLVSFTGLVIWWPGMSRVVRAMIVTRGVGWRRLNYDLHSAVGFWTFGLLLMWGLTGAYFVFPTPFRETVNFFAPVNAPRPAVPVITNPTPNAPTPQRRQRRPLTTGGKILRGFSFAHYGNFAGWPVKALWVLLGLAPVVLFISAVIMWWNRVLRPMFRKSRREAEKEMQPVA
jgi:uncharacterized iron-regulated membrane protein